MSHDNKRQWASASAISLVIFFLYWKKKTQTPCATELTVLTAEVKQMAVIDTVLGDGEGGIQWWQHFWPPAFLIIFNTSLFFRCIIPCSASHPLGSLQHHDPTSTSSPASVSAKATSREAWSRRCGMFPSALACSETSSGNDKQESKCLNAGHLNFRSKSHLQCLYKWPWQVTSERQSLQSECMFQLASNL